MLFLLEILRNRGARCWSDWWRMTLLSVTAGFSFAVQLAEAWQGWLIENCSDGKAVGSRVSACPLMRAPLYVSYYQPAGPLMNNYMRGKNLQLAECPQTASRFLCAKAGAYNKGQFVVTHLLLMHSAPLGSLFSLKANWPSEEQPCDWWRFEWSVRLSKPWGDICHRAGLTR